MSYGSQEVLRGKDFAQFTEDELAQARAMIASLRWDPGCDAPGAGRPAAAVRSICAAWSGATSGTAASRCRCPRAIAG